MQAIIGVGAEKCEPCGFVSRSCRLFGPIWHLHNRPLMRASRPFLITLASIEHTEPAVFTVSCRYVAGTLDIGIDARGFHCWPPLLPAMLSPFATRRLVNRFSDGAYASRNRTPTPLPLLAGMNSTPASSRARRMAIRFAGVVLYRFQVQHS